MKDINLQIQAFEQAPNNITAKKSTPRYIIIKYLKTKYKVLKAAKDKQHICNLIKLNNHLWLKFLIHQESGKLPQPHEEDLHETYCYHHTEHKVNKNILLLLSFKKHYFLILNTYRYKYILNNGFDFLIIFFFRLLTILFLAVFLPAWKYPSK